MKTCILTPDTGAMTPEQLRNVERELNSYKPLGSGALWCPRCSMTIGSLMALEGILAVW